MLSICIPTYNYDIRPLLDGLKEEIKMAELDVDVVVLDDGSDTKYVRMNEAHCSELDVAFIAFAENIGRSRIRNAFLPFVRREYMLFLDDDGLPYPDRFIQSYLELLNGADVVCGGRVYPNSPEIAYRLHWRYGTQQESQPVERRAINPYNAFMTNNFVVRTEVMERIPFDESIRQYGHEDTLFGMELKRQGVVIKHIDNPVVHMQIETNKDFLDKTDKGLANLARLYSERRLTTGVRLIDHYENTSKWIPNGLLCALEPLFLPILKRNLQGPRPSLFLFNLFKRIRFSRHLQQIRIKNKADV